MIIGYGKFEAVGSLMVGIMLTGAGVGMGFEGIHALEIILSSEPTVATAVVQHPSFLQRTCPGLTCDSRVFTVSYKMNTVSR